MVSRIEIGYRPGVRDARGRGVCENIRTFLNLPTEEVRTRDVFKIDANLSADEVEKVRREFTDPVIQHSALGRLEAEGFDWLITVGFRPGVTDNVGRSAKTAIEDIVGRKLGDADGVYTETQYFVRGEELSRDDAERIGRDLLANELIETIRVQSLDEWRRDPPDLSVPVIRETSPVDVAEIDLQVSDEELMRISTEGILALSLEEMQCIRDYFAAPGRAEERQKVGLGANPTDVELETLAQTWSEHCKHKIFNALIDYVEGDRRLTIDSLFKTYIR